MVCCPEFHLDIKLVFKHDRFLPCYINGISCFFSIAFTALRINSDWDAVLVGQRKYLYDNALLYTHKYTSATDMLNLTIASCKSPLAGKYSIPKDSFEVTFQDVLLTSICVLLTCLHNLP